MPDTQCIYVADREADIVEIFVEHAAQTEAADYLVRGQHDRQLSNGGSLRQALDEAPELGQIEFDLPKTENRKAQRITQTLRAVRVTLKAPYRIGIKLPDVEVTALLAQEQSPPDGADPIEWLLLTNLPIDTAEQAVEKIAWYLCRW